MPVWPTALLLSKSQWEQLMNSVIELNTSSLFFGQKIHDQRRDVDSIFTWPVTAVAEPSCERGLPSNMHHQTWVATTVYRSSLPAPSKRRKTR